MRLCLLSAFGLVTLTALLAWTPVVHGAVISAGQLCGNADTCESGYVCTLNVCVRDSSGLVNGLSNQCSAGDCCADTLACVQIQVNNQATPSICVVNSTAQPSSSLVVIGCTGQPGPAPSTVQTSTPATIGALCSETVCCGSNLACNSATKRCIPSIAQLDSITCTNTDGSTPTPCTNAVGCDANHVCVRNQCTLMSVAPAGTVSGTGNDCSGTNCCVSGLACYVGVCAPNSVDFGKTKCTATDGDNSGAALATVDYPTTGTTPSSSSTGRDASAAGGPIGISAFGAIALLAASLAMLL